jgi:hypothetical protein
MDGRALLKHFGGMDASECVTPAQHRNYAKEERSPFTVSHALQQMQEWLKELWPEGARTFKERGG